MIHELFIKSVMLLEETHQDIFIKKKININNLNVFIKEIQNHYKNNETKEMVQYYFPERSIIHFKSRIHTIQKLLLTDGAFLDILKTKKIFNIYFSNKKNMQMVIPNVTLIRIIKEQEALSLFYLKVIKIFENFKNSFQCLSFISPLMNKIIVYKNTSIKNIANIISTRILNKTEKIKTEIFRKINLSKKTLMEITQIIPLNYLRPFDENLKFFGLDHFDVLYDSLSAFLSKFENVSILSQKEVEKLFLNVKMINESKLLTLFIHLKNENYNIFSILNNHITLSTKKIIDIINKKKVMNNFEMEYVINYVEDKEYFVNYLIKEHSKLIPLSYFQLKEFENKKTILIKKILSINPCKACHILEKIEFENEADKVDILIELLALRRNISAIIDTLNIKNDSLRFKLALQWAKSDLINKSLDQIYKFNLTSEKEIFEFITQLSYTNPKLTLEYLPKSKINNLQKKYLIIEMGKRESFEIVSNEFFSFLDNKTKFILAKYQLILNPKHFFDNLSHYEINMELDKLTLIWNCLKKIKGKSLEILLQNLYLFEFNPLQIKKIYFYAIEKGFFNEVMNSLLINSPSDRLLCEILDKIYNSIKDFLTPASIFKIPFKNSSIKKEIILKYSGNPCFIISREFNAEIFSEEEKKIIAYRELKNNPRELFSFINLYKLEDENFKFKIAKALLVKGHDISNNINLFQFKNEIYKEKLCLLHSNVLKDSFSLFTLYKYDLKDENLRYSYFKNWMQKYNDEKKLIQSCEIVNLNLSEEHFFESLDTLLPLLQYRSQVKRIVCYNDLLNFVSAENQLKLIQIFVDFFSFQNLPLNAQFLTSEKVINFILLYIEKKEYDALEWIKYLGRREVNKVFKALLIGLKHNPSLIQYFSNDFLNYKNLIEIAGVIYESLKFNPIENMDKKIIEIGSLFYNDNDYEIFLKRIFFNMINNPIYRISKIFLNDLIQHPRLQKNLLVKKFFLLSKMENLFPQNYSYKDALQIIPKPFKVLLTRIEKTKNLVVKKELFEFLIYLSSQYFFGIDFKNDYKNSKSIKNIVNQIISIGDSSFKTVILERFMTFYYKKSEITSERLNLLNEKVSLVKSKASLFLMYLISFYPLIDQKLINELILIIPKIQELLFDKITQKTFLHRLHLLFLKKKDDPNAIWSCLLKMITENYSKHQILEKLSYLNALFIFDSKQEIQLDIDYKHETFINMIQKKLQLEHIEKDFFIEKMEKTFFSYSDPFALIKYIANFESGAKKLNLEENLNEESHNPAYDLLKDHVKNIFDGTYKEKRYSLNNLHLFTAFNENKRAFKIWKENYTFKLDEICASYPNTLYSFKNFKELFIKFIILDRHIPDYALINQYSDIHYILTNDITTELTLNQLEERLHKKKKLNHITKFQILFISLLNYTGEEEDAHQKIIELKNLTPSKYQFYSDLNLLAIQLRKKQFFCPKKYLGLITDDPEQIFFIGSNFNTCLKFDGYLFFNRTLIGLLADGKYKVVLIMHKKSKKIIARALIKVLLDCKTYKPVLFRETIYKTVEEPILSKVIDDLSIQLANRMKIPLLTSIKEFQDASNQLYPNAIQSMGGPSQYEYVDALDTLTSSSYIISNAKILYNLYDNFI